MATGLQGSVDVTIAFDDGPGGTARAMAGHITSEIAVEILSIMEVKTTFGDTGVRRAPTGLRDIPPFTVSGPLDTTGTTGPYAVFADPDDLPTDSTRTCTLVVGDSKTLALEGYLSRFKISVGIGRLSTWEAEFSPDDVVDWS